MRQILLLIFLAPIAIFIGILVVILLLLLIVSILPNQEEPETLEGMFGRISNPFYKNK